MLRPKQDHVGRVDHAGAFDFVRPLDGHGELVRFRDNRGSRSSRFTQGEGTVVANDQWSI
jgi:hypothetical protein